MRKSTSLSGLTFGASLLMAPTLVANAQPAELNPGFIEGTVQVGTGTISLLRIQAASDLFTAEKTLSSNATSVPYDLTVQVEQNSSRTYRVTADIFTDGTRDRLFVQDREVTVVDAEPPQPSTLDFIFSPPGFIDGTVTVVGGNINAVFIIAQPSVSPFTFFASTTELAVGGPESVDFSFPIVPGQSVNCSGSVLLTNGIQINLASKTVAPTTSGPVRCDYTIDPGDTGSIAGVIDLDGPQTVDRYLVSVSGPTGRTLVFTPPFDGPGGLNSDNYSVDLLPPGTYTVGIAQAFLNNFDDEIRFPDGAFLPSRSGLAVDTGLVTQLDIQTCQAFINGTFAFTGLASLDDLSFGQTRARGDPAIGSPTHNGLSFDRITPGTGAFDLVVNEGAWIDDFFSFNLFRPASDPDGFLNERIFLTFPLEQDNPINLLCGDVAVRDFSIPTGGIIVDFQVAGGGLLTNPELRSGSCEKRDETTNELLYRYNFDAFSSGQIDVLNGTATFLGPAATCNNIRAQATVNGTLTTFAEIDNVEIPPGEIIRPDIISPALSVTSPAPDICVNATEITVQGTVTDNVDIASVTVNGFGAILTPTSNPDGLAAVTFAAAVSLPVRGPNAIVIVAADSAGNTSTVNRNILNDGSVPTLAFTPADGTVTSLFSLNVEGLASDDGGIDSIVIAVNGIQVAVLDGGGALDVPFNQPVTLQPGPNTITVVATDLCGKSTTVAHGVTIGSPLVAVAGGNILQACTAAEGALVTLDASGSSDIGTFTWTGPFLEGGGVVTGEIVSVTAPIGTSTVTLTVNDGTDQATDSLDVTVTIQGAGLLPPLANLVQVGEDPPMPTRAFKHGRTLPLKLQLFCGATELTDAEVTPPTIVSIQTIGGAPVDLEVIDPDAGEANDSGVLFRYAAPNWIYNLNTNNISIDLTYIITIKMPDGERYDAKFALK